MYRSTYIEGLEEQICSFIKEFRDMRGYCPSTREMAEAIGVSSSTINKRLKKMEKTGWLKRYGHRAITMYR